LHPKSDPASDVRASNIEPLLANCAYVIAGFNLPGGHFSMNVDQFLMQIQTKRVQFLQPFFGKLSSLFEIA